MWLDVVVIDIVVVVVVDDDAFDVAVVVVAVVHVAAVADLPAAVGVVCLFVRVAVNAAQCAHCPA